MTELTSHSPQFINLEKQALNTSPTFGEDLALGTVAATLAFGANIAFHTLTNLVMESLGYVIQESQDIVAILEGIALIASPFLQLALKVALVAYIVFIGPLFEEYLFRDKLWSWQIAGRDLEKETWSDKTARIAVNGVLFGAAHLSLGQGLANIPIFLCTTVGGVVMATLRQWTGNSRAAKVCHVTHNSAFMACYALGL